MFGKKTNFPNDKVCWVSVETWKCHGILFPKVLSTLFKQWMCFYICFYRCTFNRQQMQFFKCCNCCFTKHWIWFSHLVTVSLAVTALSISCQYCFPKVVTAVSLTSGGSFLSFSLIFQQWIWFSTCSHHSCFSGFVFPKT